MEGLILLIATIVISSLFNSSKRKQQQDQRKGPKPFAAGQQAREVQENRPMKRLREMSKELLEDIQKEFEIEQEEVNPRPTFHKQQQIQEKEQVVSKASEIVKENDKKRTISKVPSLVNRPLKKEDIVPSTHHDIMKGIIFSEIIGPPKSKR